MRVTASQLYQRVTNVSFAVTLIISSLAVAITPFLLSHSANAAPYSSYTNTTFGGLAFSPDRATPSGGYALGTDSLTLTVNNNNASPLSSSNAFYLTEGLNATLPSGKNSIKADLFIDPAWAGKPVRAGLWGVSTNGVDTGWPIIEFTNNFPGAGFDGLRVWDTNTGDWYNISTPTYGSTVELEVAINPYTQEYEFYVNGIQVKHYTTDGLNTLKGVIFNNRNSATLNVADNYSVTWSNLETGVRALDTPVNLQPVNGTATNNHAFSMSWDAVDGATKYEYRTSNSLINSTTLGSIAYSDNSSGANYTLGAATITRDNNGTPPANWYWQVRAGDDNGNWSSWSAISLVTTDYTAPNAPSLNSPAHNAVVNGASVTQSWNASTSTDIDHYVYQSYNDDSASSASIRWTGSFTGLSKTATNVANATYYWRVKAVDHAGNESAWSPLWKITIDNTAPAAPTLVTPSPYIANGANKTLDWNAPADTDIVYYEYAEYNSSAPTSDTTTPSWVKVVNAPTTETTDTAWQSDIKIYWRVRAVDAAGNKGDWSETRLIVSDRTKPTVAIDSYAFVAGDLSVQVTGTDNLSGVKRIGFNLYNASNTTLVKSLKTVDFTGYNLSETSTLANLDISDVPSGTYVIRAAARDVANNLSQYALQTITIDNTAPVVTIDSFSAVGNVITPAVTSDDATVSYAWVANDTDSATNVTISNPTFKEPTFTVNVDGTYSFTLTVTDAAGNTDTDTFSFTYTTPVANNNINNNQNGDGDDDQGDAFTGIFASGAVLGATTDGTTDSDAANNGTSDVEGASTNNFAAVDTDATDGSIFGLAWYWWLLILAALAAITSWIVAAIRRRNNSEA